MNVCINNKGKPCAPLWLIRKLLVEATKDNFYKIVKRSHLYYFQFRNILRMEI